MKEKKENQNFANQMEKPKSNSAKRKVYSQMAKDSPIWRKKEEKRPREFTDWVVTFFSYHEYVSLKFKLVSLFPVPPPHWRPSGREADDQMLGTSSSCKITSTLELTPPQYPVPLGPFPSSVEEECKLLPLCRAKPSPSFIHLPASNPATCQNNQSAKLQTGVYMKKPQDCLGLLECMHANLQLQTKLAQQQMAILEDLQSSMTLLIPGGEGKDSLLPAIRPNLLLTCQPQISK
ncbi:TSSK6-activating co-chaperone protein isoform X3 [Macrotis lagotis]|uniref:TSSK6-activating co-chaperone protein isoform X3 n=1 Tax=Macrotis lagotis TaxID=92651 RepID=UPI003D6892CB